MAAKAEKDLFAPNDKSDLDKEKTSVKRMYKRILQQIENKYS
jgi:hypothetical protein